MLDPAAEKTPGERPTEPSKKALDGRPTNTIAPATIDSCTVLLPAGGPVIAAANRRNRQPRQEFGQLPSS